MTEEDLYYTIRHPASAEIREKGSRFLGFSFPVASEDEVKEILQKVKKEHPKANHHCYAFRLSTDPSAFRCSDDREPSGSAGKPILGTIQSNNLADILLIIVRYFGGSLLGVPGLIAAYRSSANAVIKNSEIIEKTINVTFTIQFPYELINEVHHFLKNFPIQIKTQNFNPPCTIIFDIRRKFSQEIRIKFGEHPRLSYLATLEN